MSRGIHSAAAPSRVTRRRIIVSARSPGWSVALPNAGSFRPNRESDPTTRKVTGSFPPAAPLSVPLGRWMRPTASRRRSVSCRAQSTAPATSATVTASATAILVASRRRGARVYRSRRGVEHRLQLGQRARPHLRGRGLRRPPVAEQVEVVHTSPPSIGASERPPSDSRARSSDRARWMRDRTVPGGTPSASDTSS